MSNNFTPDEDGFDEFQELLNNLPGLSPVIPGKRGRGGGRNNIGADVLGYKTLQELRTNYHVDLFEAGNLKGNTLWGIIDQKSFDRAKQISMSIEPSYSQVGVLAVSLARTDDGTIFVQWWKATVVKGVLSFSKVLRKGADYQLCANREGKLGLWKMDATTGLPREKNEQGDYISFPFNELVDFEVYLNAIVELKEIPVTFPKEEVSKLQNLSDILANVNFNVEVPAEAAIELDDENDDADEEVEEE